MRITVLGSGSSPGVPYLGCTCEVCTSTDPRDKRLRASVLVETKGVRILIDTAPDLRAQCLRENILHIDAVLFTHTHADHIYGLDDLRAFKWLMDKPIECFAPREVLEYLKCAYPYVFSTGPEYGGGKPHLIFHQVNGAFEFSGVKIEPLRLPHGPNMITTAYLIDGKFAYLIDCSEIPEVVLEKVKGVSVAVIDLVQKREGHQTHLTWNEARKYANQIQPKLAVYTHLGHEIKHSRDLALLNPTETLAYDGMVIEIDESANPRILKEEKP